MKKTKTLICPHCGSHRKSHSVLICPSCARMYPSKDTKECPKCFQIIPNKALVCSFCKTSLQPVSEIGYLGSIIIINLILFKLYDLIGDYLYFHVNANLFLVLSFLILFIIYIFCGVLLGVMIPYKRTKSIIIYTLGITILNEIFWPSNFELLITVISTIITLIWVFTSVMLGMLIGNKIGSYFKCQILHQDNWNILIKFIVLAFTSCILRTIFDLIIRS